MTRDDLIRDAAWDILGENQADADKIRQQLRTPVPKPVVKVAPVSVEQEFDAPEAQSVRLVGDLAAGAAWVREQLQERLTGRRNQESA